MEMGNRTVRVHDWLRLPGFSRYLSGWKTDGIRVTSDCFESKFIITVSHGLADNHRFRLRHRNAPNFHHSSFPPKVEVRLR